MFSAFLFSPIFQLNFSFYSFLSHKRTHPHKTTHTHTHQTNKTPRSLFAFRMPAKCLPCLSKPLINLEAGGSQNPSRMNFILYEPFSKRIINLLRFKLLKEEILDAFKRVKNSTFSAPLLRRKKLRRKKR